MAHDRAKTTGIKRRFCDIATDDGTENNRPCKRISPFHNTPIQKKETKRRILKISLKKMKEIDCPETFLRRSVLINNLARSLQDDLKDDKIWERWGWDCDLDTFPSRSPHPVPHRPTGCELPRDSSTTCTLLTNACTSSSTNQWTLSTHAHWINGDDDAHLSPLERERVTRDLVQSHDRLALTVERLTCFSDDSPEGGESPTFMDISGSDKTSLTVKDKTCTRNSLPSGSTSNLATSAAPLIVPELCSCGVPLDERTPEVNLQQGMNLESLCTLRKCGNCTAESTTCFDSNPSLFMDSVTSKQSQCVSPSNSTQPTHSNKSPLSHQVLTDLPSCQFSPTPGVRNSSAADTWKCNRNLPTSVNTTACSTRTNEQDTSPLTGVLPVVPHCSTAIQSFAMFNSADGFIDSNANQYDTPGPKELSESPKHPLSQGACRLEAVDMAGNDLWSLDSTLDSCTTSNSGLLPSHQGARAADLERNGNFSQSDQEKFSSQALRDFEVIYNNLVSVLIGGN